MARETTKWPSTRWPITKIMSSDGCNGNKVPLEMGPWYDFREFGCHLGNVGWIKEGKNAIKWTRLSCRKFLHNAVRLQLHALAYNLGNFMRTLVLPDAVEQWSLTTLREKLVKIGAKIVRHGRYIVFQMAEVSIPRDLFTDILRRIDRLRTTPLPTLRHDRPSCVKTPGPVCPRHGPTGNIECHHVPFTLNFVLSGMILVAQPIGLAL